jgi:hypothetical protein
MGRAGKQVVQEGSNDDIPIAQRKRKVGTSAQHPRGRGRTVPLAAPRRSTDPDHRARSKQAHAPDDHYDDYETSLWTCSICVEAIPSSSPDHSTWYIEDGGLQKWYS